MAYDPRYDEGTEILDMPPDPVLKAKMDNERRLAKLEMQRKAAQNSENWLEELQAVTRGALDDINARYHTMAEVEDLRECDGCGNMVPKDVLGTYKRQYHLCPDCLEMSGVIDKAYRDMCKIPFHNWRVSWANAMCYYYSLYSRDRGEILPNSDAVVRLYYENAEHLDPESTEYVPPERLAFNEDFAVSGYGTITSTRGAVIYKAILENLKMLSDSRLAEALRGICDVLDDGGNTL